MLGHSWEEPGRGFAIAHVELAQRGVQHQWRDGARRQECPVIRSAFGRKLSQRCGEQKTHQLVFATGPGHDAAIRVSEMNGHVLREGKRVVLPSNLGKDGVDLPLDPLPGLTFVARDLSRQAVACGGRQSDVPFDPSSLIVLLGSLVKVCTGLGKQLPRDVQLQGVLALLRIRLSDPLLEFSTGSLHPGDFVMRNCLDLPADFSQFRLDLPALLQQPGLLTVKRAQLALGALGRLLQDADTASGLHNSSERLRTRSGVKQFRNLVPVLRPRLEIAPTDARFVVKEPADKLLVVRAWNLALQGLLVHKVERFPADASGDQRRSKAGNPPHTPCTQVHERSGNLSQPRFVRRPKLLQFPRSAVLA